ncbi:Ctr86 protein [Saccharomycopsis crataegensis]|uniref:Ataxin-10 homolog n=1 Tax=Saccharomycopsis crataegensis TaxID=43959 RepID=A0AAV5QQX1_9ASCO|nr:Ctr86 protein [Saccharomycopsis crataegensis]
MAIDWIKIFDDLAKETSEDFLGGDLQDGHFARHFQELARLIGATSDLDNQELRNQFISQNPEVFEKIEGVIENSHSISADDINLTTKLRLLRGFILLLRNILVIDNQQQSIKDYGELCDNLIRLHKIVLKSLIFVTKSFHETNIVDASFFISKLVPCYLQCLTNLSGNFKNAVIQQINPENVVYSEKPEDYHLIIQYITELFQLNTTHSFFSPENHENYNLLLIYLNHFIVNNYSIFNHELRNFSEDEVTNGFLYHLLNNESPEIVEALSEWFIELHDELHYGGDDEDKIVEIKQESADKNQTFVTFSSIFKNIIIHESFGKFFTINRPNKKMSTNLILISQILLTNFSNLSNLKLVIILTWLMNFYESLLAEATEYFDQPGNVVDVKSLNDSLFMVLDIFTSLLTYDYSIQYLNNYTFLTKLIDLLKLLQKHVQPISKLSLATKAAHLPSQFPNLKKLLIENITYLVSKNFDNQELVRTSHALEIVLSNCIIDQLNPYIKETAIICIRYLLEDNKENQDFVRKLEAKKVVNEDELKDKGVELELVDGKVQFKKN